MLQITGVGRSMLCSRSVLIAPVVSMTKDPYCRGLVSILAASDRNLVISAVSRARYGVSSLGLKDLIVKCSTLRIQPY